ncbi:hypothetical protein A0H81_00449 [Grifola frondosa]|uniref:Uncharacterized protein n=1 Tax=Grifola frondosa TaxID=5627 RepID=A0A1C7MNZ0_GRIFR|nr:hypothetical protein A0H81_00449 [Grifola frondosa]
MHGTHLAFRVNWAAITTESSTSPRNAKFSADRGYKAPRSAGATPPVLCYGSRLPLSIHDISKQVDCHQTRSRENALIFSTCMLMRRGRFGHVRDLQQAPVRSYPDSLTSMRSGSGDTCQFAGEDRANAGVMSAAPAVADENCALGHNADAK